MPATRWRYYSRYCDDPAEALDCLRLAVFETQRYRIPQEEARRALADLEAVAGSPDRFAAAAMNAWRSTLPPNSADLRSLEAEARALDAAAKSLFNADIAKLDSFARHYVKMGRMAGAAVRTQYDMALLVEEFRRIAKRVADGRPACIGDLERMDDGRGTHSILDIDAIAPMTRRTLFQKPRPEPGPRLAAPLDPVHATELFGCNRPMREDVERALLRIQAGLPAGEAIYATVYENDTLSAYAFVGRTGA